MKTRFLLLLAILVGCSSSPTDRDNLSNSIPEIVSSAIIESGPLVRTLNLTLKKSTTVEVEYWTGQEPRRRATSPSAVSHAVLLARLHAGRTYQYKVVGTTHEGTFATDSLPADLANISFNTTGVPSVPLVLVHLYHAQGGFRGYAIIDSGGEVVWYWRTQGFPFGMTRRNNGNFVFLDKDAGLFEVDPNGNVVHSLPQDTTMREMHHDAIASSQNTILFIAFDHRKVDTVDLKGEAIWEWIPETGATSKRWNSWDFLSYHTDRGARSLVEWMHANSLGIGPRGNIVLSAHYLNQIISIQSDFKAIEWRLGGVNPTIAVDSAEQFSGQHTAYEIAPGRVVMFDNRLERKGYSRAVEFEMTGNTAHKVWEWSAIPPNYSAAISSARRLANGNTMVAFGMGTGMSGSSGPNEAYEVTAAGNAIWHLVVGNITHMYRVEPVSSVAGEE